MARTEGTENKNAAASGRRWSFGTAVLDESSMILRVNGQAVDVERKVLEVLRYLLQNAGKLATKDQLLQAVWPGRILTETVLTKCIAKLREALGDEQQTLIATVHGYGYRLDAPVRSEDCAQPASSAAAAPISPPDSTSSATGSTRRLTAIMFTDMVGYSALVQKNEPLAMELLDTHRKLVRKLIRGFGGREVETAGDSFLIEFGSALDAMNCAIAMQQRHAAHNASAGPERHITIRIGLHVGDIEHRKGGKVFGDGVNLAARIEPLAPPGGVAVSGQFHAQVRHRAAASFNTLGRQALKNIVEPMEVFALDAGAIAAWPAPQPLRLMPARLDWRWGAAVGGVLVAAAVAISLWRMTPAHVSDNSISNSLVN